MVDEDRESLAYLKTIGSNGLPLDPLRSERSLVSLTQNDNSDLENLFMNESLKAKTIQDRFMQRCSWSCWVKHLSWDSLGNSVVMTRKQLYTIGTNRKVEEFYPKSKQNLTAFEVWNDKLCLASEAHISLYDENTRSHLISGTLPAEKQ